MNFPIIWISQFSPVQLLHRVRLFAIPGTAACQAPCHHQLLELAKLKSIESVMPSNHLILCYLLLLPSVFPTSGSFPISGFFTLGSQCIGASASASVLPMNIQDWFPLGLTGRISLQSKGLSRVFSNTTVQKHQFFGIQLSFRISQDLTIHFLASVANFHLSEKSLLFLVW